MGFLTPFFLIFTCPKTHVIFNYKKLFKTEVKHLVLIRPKRVVFGQGKKLVSKSRLGHNLAPGFIRHPISHQSLQLK